jgi:hypothetical protein
MMLTLNWSQQILSCPVPPAITFSAVAAIAAAHFFCRQPLFHCSHHLFSPRMRSARCMSFGIIVTHFAWSAHSLVLLKRPTRYASAVCSLLEGKEGCALHLQIRLYATSNLADKTLEGYLPHQKVRVLLVFTDLTKGDGPRALTMGFLHASKGSG